MRWLAVAALAAASAGGAAAEGGDWAEVQELVAPLRDANDSVIALTDATFKHVVFHPATRFAFIEFYAPWCPHCKALAPILAELSQAVAQDPAMEGVVVAKVDVTEQRAIGQWYNVVNFPTLYSFYSRTKINPYHGKRELDPMLQHLMYTVQTRPKSVSFGLFGKRGLALPEKTYAHAYIDRFDSPLGQTVQRFALRQDWLGVGAITGTPPDDDLFGKIVISSADDGPFIEGPAGVTGEIPVGNVTKLEEWVEASRTPLVYLHKETDQGKEIFATTRTNYHCLVFVEAGADDAEVLAAVTGAAKAPESKVQHTLVYVDAATKAEHPLYNQVMDYVGAGDLPLPVAVMVEVYIRRFRKGNTFLGGVLPVGQPSLVEHFGLAEPAPFTADTLVDYEAEYIARKLPHLEKNEADDASEMAKGFTYMQHLVAKDFEAKVVEGDKDVVLALYQEGCEHCGRIDLNLSKDGLMIPSCGVCSYSERERLLKNWFLYLDKMDGLAGMFRNVESLDFYVLNAANNTLRDPQAYGMSVGYLWTPGYYMFKANDKKNPERAMWPGSFLDNWIKETVSIPFDETLLVVPEPPPPPAEETAEEADEEEEEDAEWEGEEVPEDEGEEDETASGIADDEL